MNTPSLLEMLKSGVHFGHRTSKWHPAMAPFIYTTKQKIHILNLASTQQKLQEAMQAAAALAAAGKQILFVGTKHQATAIVKQYAEQAGMPYVNHRWLGGTLTNFFTISSVARKLTKLKTDRDLGELKKYTKKEQLEFDREIERLDILVGGIEQLFKMPDAVFIVDLKEEKTALREALQMKIPIFAMCDSNVDPRNIDYPIPANDDAIKSIDLVVAAMAEAIAEGKQQRVEAAAAALQEEAAPTAEAPTATPSQV